MTSIPSCFPVRSWLKSPFLIAAVGRVMKFPGIHRVPVHLEIEKEERSIAAVVEFGNPHRTAHGPAEVVLAAARVRVGERTGSVEVLVGQVLVGRAVQVVRSRARREIV